MFWQTCLPNGGGTFFYSSWDDPGHSQPMNGRGLLMSSYWVQSSWQESKIIQLTDTVSHWHTQQIYIPPPSPLLKYCLTHHFNQKEMELETFVVKLAKLLPHTPKKLEICHQNSRFVVKNLSLFYPSLTGLAKQAGSACSRPHHFPMQASPTPPSWVVPCNTNLFWGSQAKELNLKLLKKIWKTWWVSLRQRPCTDLQLTHYVALSLRESKYSTKSKS